MSGEAYHEISYAQMDELPAFMGRGGGSGKTYRDFMAGLLKAESEETLRKRCMDLIEQNIKNNGHPGFRIDGCITFAEIRLEISSGYGGEYSAKRSLGYLEQLDGE